MLPHHFVLYPPLHLTRCTANQFTKKIFLLNLLFRLSPPRWLFTRTPTKRCKISLFASSCLSQPPPLARWEKFYYLSASHLWPISSQHGGAQCRGAQPEKPCRVWWPCWPWWRPQWRQDRPSTSLADDRKRNLFCCPQSDEDQEWGVSRDANMRKLTSLKSEIKKSPEIWRKNPRKNILWIFRRVAVSKEMIIWLENYLIKQAIKQLISKILKSLKKTHETSIKIC